MNRRPREAPSAVDLPAGWVWSRLGQHFDHIDERSTTGDERLLSVSKVHGVIPRDELTDRVARADTLVGYKRCRAGDLIVNQMSAYDGLMGITKWDGIVTYHYLVFRPSRAVHAAFVAYVLTSRLYQQEFSRRVRGLGESTQGSVRTPHIRIGDMLQTVMALPTLTVQRAIADYLDTESARIDALITKKQRMIEVLEERWRAAVSELTAHGAPVAVRRLTSVRTSGPRGWAELVHDEGTAPFIRSANLRRDDVRIRVDNLAFVDPPETVEAQRSRTRAGDVLIGITGANTGWVGVVNEPEAGGYVSQHVAVLRPAGVDPSWLAFSLFSDRAQQTLLGSQYGGTKTQLGLEDLAEVVINVPDESQQRYLTGRLDALRGVTEALRRSLGTQLELLREHRQALITAAVTGELEVPGVAA